MSADQQHGRKDADERYAALQTIVAKMADEIGSCKDVKTQQEETAKKESALEKLV